VRAVVVVLIASACGGTDPPPGEPALFPADYAATYQEVRNCRNSIEHGFVRVRVVAAPDAIGPYMDRTTPFPAGAIVLKEEYDDADTACAGPVKHYTVMQKLAGGSAPAALDWEWQAATPQFRAIADEDLQSCITCHTDCGKPPDGYDGTCTVP
jgi:hypothetical protein